MRNTAKCIGKAALATMIGAALSPITVGGEFTLEEIIVTAQKRPQTLQDVPLSVSAVDGEFVADAAITEIAGLGEFVPNLQTSASPFNSIITIRGLGSGGANRAFEQSVAMFIDGTYAGRSNQFLTPFFDVERIEIVRGPQGVLFGKNAIAGGISVVSAKPTDDFEANVKASYELENDGHAMETVISGPLSDTLRGRLAAKAAREGGYLESTTTGDDDGEIDSYVVRGILDWDVTDDLQLSLKLENARRDQEGNLFQISEIPATGATSSLFALVGGDTTERLDDKRSADSNEFTNIETDNLALNVEYATDAGVLTWVSSYSGYDYEQLLDADMSSLAFAVLPAMEEFEQFSHEIRFTSELGNTIDYIVGANYLDQEINLGHGFDFNFPTLNPLLLAGGATTLPPFGVSPRWRYDQDTSSWSVFGEVTWNIKDNLRVALGLRYTEEKKEASLASTVSALGAPIADDPVARAVLADNTDGLASFDGKTDMPQHPMLVIGLGRHVKPVRQSLPLRTVRPIGLAQIADSEKSHSESTISGAARRNMNSPSNINAKAIATVIAISSSFGDT